MLQQLALNAIPKKLTQLKLCNIADACSKCHIKEADMIKLVQQCKGLLRI